MLPISQYIPKRLRWHRNAQVLTEPCRSVFEDFPMARNGGPAACDRVLPDRMVSTLTHKLTPVLTQVTQQVTAFHDTVS
jgi:hypothetical protein